MKNENLVSIIMPSYNSQMFIEKSINSVINQTYQNWELIIIDDCSSDLTKEIIKKYAIRDSRVKIEELDKNSGAAIARNVGIKKAEGDYIAFLDSDDLWKEEKLEKQIEFMKTKSIYFCCTYYDKVDEHDQYLNEVVKYKNIMNYDDFLKSGTGNSTVIFNAKELGKFYAKNLRRRNDYVLWLDVIKKSNYLYCLNEVLGSHRVRSNSISSKKIKLIKYHWYIYRKIERINLLKSLYLVFYWCFKGIIKNFNKRY